MTLRYSYRRFPVKIQSLRLMAPTGLPVCPISFVGPIGTYFAPGLLDTAADDVILSDLAAVKMGIDLSSARRAKPPESAW